MQDSQYYSGRGHDEVWLTRAPKGSSYAQVAAHAVKGERDRKLQKQCYLLKLPIEVRKSIWRYLIRHPSALVPRPGCRSPNANGNYVYGKVYEDERHDTRRYCYIKNGLSSFYSFNAITTSKPTYQQAKLIQAGRDIPNTIIDGKVTTHTQFKAEGMPTAVLNKSHCTAVAAYLDRRICNVMVLCKRIELDFAEVLYGENTFVLDARGKASMVYGHFNSKEFEATRHDIPGLSNRYGVTRTEQRTSSAIEHMFDQSRHQSKFAREDPLMRFFYQIGPKNAAILNKVVIEGHFKIASVAVNKGPAGFNNLLPIYSTILRKVCPNLRLLTLHMGSDTEPYYMSARGPKVLANHLIHQELTKYDQSDIRVQQTDEEMIDEAVEMIVRSLPTLTELKLGNYKSTSIPRQDMRWKKSVRWIKAVENRSRSS